MKTLIHIIPTVQNGGAETVLVRLAEEWFQKGVKQFVITIQGNEKDHHHDRLSQYCELIHSQSQLQKSIQCFKDNPDAKILAWMYKGIRKAYQWRKIARTEQEIIWNIRRSYFRRYEWKQQLGLFVYGLFTQWYKPRIVFCAHVAKKAHVSYGFYQASSKVIENRLAKKRSNSFSASPLLPEKFLLYVGRYNLAKGPDRLLRIMENYLRQNGQLPLIIAGRGWENINVSKGLKSHVIFLGNVNDVEVLFENATAFLFTSFTEGYPNVVVEAIAQGTPVVGFEAGDSRSILADYPFGYTVETEDEFLNKLNDLLDASPTKEERQKEALRQQKKLDFSLTVKEYEQFIWNN